MKLIRDANDDSLHLGIGQHLVIIIVGFNGWWISAMRFSKSSATSHIAYSLALRALRQASKCPYCEMGPQPSTATFNVVLFTAITAPPVVDDYKKTSIDVLSQKTDRVYRMFFLRLLNCSAPLKLINSIIYYKSRRIYSSGYLSFIFAMYLRMSNATAATIISPLMINCQYGLTPIKVNP